MNGKPGFTYVLVGKDVREEYEFRGYEIVLNEGHPDAPRISTGRTSKTGEPLTYKDMLLMSCTADRHEQIVSEGEEGNSGQRWADMIEEHIIDKRRTRQDLLRGIQGGSAGLSVDFEEDPIEQELLHRQTAQTA